MPSATLILQSLASGVFIGSLYGLIGLGLGLGWGLLRVINLMHFAWAVLAAYITYELRSRLGIDPLLALVFLVPAFGLLGMGLQALTARFAITPFSSLLATFGLTAAVEALLQLIWSADFRRMSSIYEEHKIRLGTVVLNHAELITIALSFSLAAAVWWMLNRTDAGKAMRAAAEDTQIATAVGLDARRLSLRRPDQRATARETRLGRLSGIGSRTRYSPFTARWGEIGVQVVRSAEASTT